MSSSHIKEMYDTDISHTVLSQIINAVEGFHRQIRKVTKTKEAFTNDMSLLKLIYLATKNIEKKWTAPLHNWSLTIQQFYIKFGDRIPLDLNANSSGASPRGIETTDRV